jgi:hypothetical protein
MARRLLRTWIGTSLALLAGCGDETVCLLYACVNSVKLSGTVEVPPDLSQVDALFCEDGNCQQVAVDLKATSMQDCQPWSTNACLTLTGSQLGVVAVWRHTEGDDPPHGRPYRLQLTDHATGKVLVDETRTAEADVTREDNCHVCWNAEMKL